MQRVLVTGGAGYIGSQVVTHLLSAGYYVRVLDSLQFGDAGLRNFRSHTHFALQNGDIRVPADVAEACENIDTVIHLAAIVGEPACNKNPALAKEVNAHGSSLVMKQALAAGIRRFIFASTCSNYGRMHMQDGWVDETSPLEPLSLYAETKVGFEIALLQAQRENFTPVVLRFATAYGISRRPRFDLTVNEFAATLASGRQLEVYGEQFWRPYCHVDDIAVACRLALEADESVVKGKVFNVGATTENYQKQTLMRLVLEQLPEAKQLVQFIHRDHDPRDYRVNCDKIRQTLGFAVKKTVIDGIREIIDCIKSGAIADFTDAQFRNA